MKLNPKNLLVPIALGLLCAGSAQATTTNYDFNSDPTTFLTISGNAVWSSTGGVGVSTNVNDGFLIITPAANSQFGKIIFPDFDAGSVIQGFTFEADMRIGNGTQTPADGFSISYCRANDPALTGNTFAGNGPEEGTTTGLGVGFDAFENSADDPVALDIWVDGVQVKQLPMPTLNGACTDATSIQTGAWDGSGSDASLCWAHVKVALGTDGKLNVYWKGVHILTDFQTAYFPSPSRLVFAGRTGGLNQNQEIDNISITTIAAALALVGQPTAAPDGFTVSISDSGNSVVNSSTVTAKLNGTAVTPTSVTKNGAVTAVVYHGFPTLIPAGSTNSVFISCLDTNGNTITGTGTFVEPFYPIIPAADAVTGVNTSLPGFTLLPWQSAGEPNAVYWMLEQLSGLRGTNNAGFTTPQTFTGVINFNINPSFVTGGGEAGNFTTNNGYADALFPGIPGANGLNGSSALNVQCFLQFQNPGIYTMGVNSDDGFLVSEAPNPNDWFGHWLGSYNGGKGSSDIVFTFAVTNAGIYPFRLAWENGNGELPGNGANLEWFTIKNGVKILVNDPSVTNNSGVGVFYAGPALPAYVSAVEPNPGSGGNLPNKVYAQITDVGTTLTTASVKLYVNGAQKTPTSVNKAGSVTTIDLDLPYNDLLPAGSNRFALVWSDSANTAHSNYWTMNVASYVTLDPSLAGPLGSEDVSRPGFALRAAQVDPCLPNVLNPSTPSDCGDGTETDVDSAEGMIAGLYYPSFGTNSADVSDSMNGFLLPAVTNNLWYWSNAMDFNIVTSPGDFPYDYKMPGNPNADGIAGSRTHDSFSAAFDCYIPFPTAGFYVMGVSSDDGFRLSEGLGVSRQILHVTGTNVSRDVLAVPSTKSSVGGVWQGVLPTVPMTAPIAYVDTSSCPGPSTMNLSGKIALIDGNRCNGDGSDGNYNALVAMCQANGAVAVIVQASPGWGTPERMSGGTTTITIPALHIIGYNGEKEWFHTNGPLMATIGADTHLMIGEANYGKGMDHQDRGFVVPQAGVYPMHLIYDQGGGGAGLEWTTVGPWTTVPGDGTRLLVNDAAATGSFMAYRGLTTAPSIKVLNVGGNTQIRYIGVLRSSPTVNGTYNVVPNAGNPYNVPPGTGPAIFYRASQN